MNAYAIPDPQRVSREMELQLFILLTSSEAPTSWLFLHVPATLFLVFNPHIPNRPAFLRLCLLVTYTVVQDCIVIRIGCAGV